MCVNVQGKMGEDEGDFGQVVSQVVGNCTKVISQGAALQLGFLGLCHSDLPGDGAILEGVPPDHRNVARWMRRRWLEIEGGR